MLTEFLRHHIKIVNKFRNEKFKKIVQKKKNMSIQQKDFVYITKDETLPLPSLEVTNLGDCLFDNIYASPEPFVNGMKLKLSSLVVNNELIGHEEVELAGPSEKIFYNPFDCKVGIITCGGLCPGLNNVIRALVLNLYNRYNVHQIFGLRWGFEGLNPELSNVIKLTPTIVNDIHQKGGSILGSSRGEQQIEVMAQFLINNNFNILFTLGGDGTLKASSKLNEELRRRNVPITVVGIPKTVDNDICYTDNTFGFNTAVELAQQAINSIHNEAKSAKNGIGIVRLMGRDAGFIALYASISNGDVNMVLLPEMSISIETICEFVKKRLLLKGHIVIVLAEGALQDQKPKDIELRKDKSGNIIHWNCLDYLKERIKEYLEDNGFNNHTIKSVDPSYMIRSAPCNATDAHYCMTLANAAVHVAMAGKTGVVICHHHNNYVSIPMNRAIHFIKRVNPNGPLLTMFNSIETNIH